LPGAEISTFFAPAVRCAPGLVTIGEETGAFQRDVDAVVAVRQLARIALGGDLDAAAVDDEVVAVRADFAGIGAVDGIALEQERVRFRVGEIVDRDELQPAILLLKQRPRHEASDPPETVNRNSCRHALDLLTI
jgi:hypothetical protein